ncbi:hypothetical protein KUCAC02_032780, partial [Chaenocephalus aceratus]
EQRAGGGSSPGGEELLSGISAALPASSLFLLDLLRDSLLPPPDLLLHYGFGDLRAASGLKVLNGFLSERSYIEGRTWQCSTPCPAPRQLTWSMRCAGTTTSLSYSQRSSLPGVKKASRSVRPSRIGRHHHRLRPSAPKEEEDDDDDIDLFGSDEEEDEEAERLKEERLAQYAAKKSKKPTIIAKSSLLLDVKPWDDETDMKQLEALVRSISMEGLLWGQSKLLPVGYGIQKLQINCVIEDDKVGTDMLEEQITAFEDFVQSMDVAAFNKI